jgi:hypothetical protein
MLLDLVLLSCMSHILYCIRRICIRAYPRLRAILYYLQLHALAMSSNTIQTTRNLTAYVDQ